MTLDAIAALDELCAQPPDPDTLHDDLALALDCMEVLAATDGLDSLVDRYGSLDSIFAVRPLSFLLSQAADRDDTTFVRRMAQEVATHIEPSYPWACVNLLTTFQRLHIRQGALEHGLVHDSLVRLLDLGLQGTVSTLVASAVDVLDFLWHTEPTGSVFSPQDRMTLRQRLREVAAAGPHGDEVRLALEDVQDLL